MDVVRGRGDLKKELSIYFVGVRQQSGVIALRGKALSCYSININKAHQSAWKEANSLLMSETGPQCDKL